jgi:hypothetical protein
LLQATKQAKVVSEAQRGRKQNKNIAKRRGRRIIRNKRVYISIEEL